MRRILFAFIMSIFLIICSTPSTAAATQYNVVDSGEASPQQMIGVYTENGTNHDRPCYEGPNSYWLYHALWFGDGYWMIGKPLGDGEINNPGVHFYYYDSGMTPPLDVDFFSTNSSSGKVRVTNSAGSPPGVPEKPFYANVASSSFTCIWLAVNNASSYKIDVSTDSDFSTFVTGYNGKEIPVLEGQTHPSSASITGLQPGTTYYFRVRTANDFGDSDNSPATTVTTVPGKPDIQAASEVSQAGFCANWLNQSGVSYYYLYVSTVADFSSYVLNNQYVGTNCYSVTGLSPNTIYYYRVKAYNISGESEMSNTMSVTTAPDKPATLPADGITADSFTAKWQLSTAATGYYLDVASDSSFTSMVSGYNNKDVEGVTSYTVNVGLNSYTNYYIRVRAYNANGTSTSSLTESVRTLPVLPSVTTDSVSEIGIYSAEAVGNITSLGVPAPEQYGFCWNTTGAPTISDSKSAYGPAESTGGYNGSLNSLLASTRYYVRAYATNAAGTAYGQAISFTTLAANTAPVLNNLTPALGGTDEDSVSMPIVVNTFLDATDEDLPPDPLGIAINSHTGNGTWQFSTDGTSWSSFGSLSPTASLLLAPTAHIRYIPDGINKETAAFTFRVWDGTSSSQGQMADTTVNGGYSAFSTAVGTASLTVSPVNDAPVLVSTTAILTGTDENTPSNSSLVSSFLQAVDIDIPADSLGIAITNITGRGTWQYSIDSYSWVDVISISPSNALLLIPGAGIRYVPDGMNGETVSFTYRAWDGTSGTAFGYYDVTTNGGTTAFSSTQGTATLAVSDVNNAPSLTSDSFAFSTTDIITASNPYLASDIAAMSDVDSGAMSGIAVYAATGHGNWQYSINGVTWSDFSTVSAEAALLLSSTSGVRYVPDAVNGETASFSFRGWDQTSGSPGDKAATTINGGTSTFSANFQTASILVTVPVYTISGLIATDGAGLAGVPVNGFPENLQTDSSGLYTAEVSYGWSGTISPELEGYTFVPAARSYSSVNSDHLSQNYEAILNTYDISTIASPLEGGSATCIIKNGLDIPHGTEVTVTAEAAYGYSFINWSENGSQVSTDASYVFTAANDRELKANFGFNPIQVIEIPSIETVPIILPPGLMPQDVEYQISVNTGVTNPKIKLAVTGGIAVTPQISITTPSQVKLDIPAGTIISGPTGWDGTIGLPVISDTASEKFGNSQFVIKVGLESGCLDFAEPVRLYAPGQGKKKIKVIRDGTVYDVVEVLSSNNIDAAREKLQGAVIDAKYIDGNDLYIWTVRFSEFVAFTQQTSSNKDSRFGSNGGLISKIGIIVSIPPDALSSFTSVKIEQIADISGILPDEGRFVSGVFKISGDYKDKFNKALRITLPFDNSKVVQSKDRISLYWYDDRVSLWKELDDVVVNWDSTITGGINHFATLAVITTDKTKEIPALPEQPTEDVAFQDVVGHWAQDSIEKLIEKGAISGYPDDSFRPNRTITRAEFAVVLVKAFELTPRQGKVFGDTAEHWAKDFIATANAYGIINGYNEDQFGPDDLVTREQLAVMISLAAGINTDVTDLDFADKADISDWAIKYVAAADKNNIISGYPNGSFLPQGKATRAEAVVIIVNAIR